METKILQQLTTQEGYLISLMRSLENRRINYKENKNFLFDRAKLIGMIEIAKTLELDVTEFTWIYNAV